MRTWLVFLLTLTLSLPTMATEESEQINANAPIGQQENVQNNNVTTTTPQVSDESIDVQNETTQVKSESVPAEGQNSVAENKGTPEQEEVVAPQDSNSLAENGDNSQADENTPEDDARLDDYLLGTGDRIEIIVYGEPDMSMKFKVAKSGVVNFPYIGEVVISGRPPSEIETEIEDRLRGDFLLNPSVIINMEAFRLFYIFGEVTSPNGYEFQPRLTVEQAIAIAGGFTDRADRDDISIRSGATDEVIEDVELTHLVQPGDTVIVDQSFF